MSRFRDWLFSHVFLPSKKKWAQQRVRELLAEREQAYSRLMEEVQKMKEDIGEGNDHGP